ncbi:hypothetical protein ACLB9X_19225 [Streptomyces sp. 5K101]|uniref:hypothetical protein n=1 Tax=Streptomyces sp. 5K101 TaxID=3390037 RepID=UPI0039758238
MRTIARPVTGPAPVVASTGLGSPPTRAGGSVGPDTTQIAAGAAVIAAAAVGGTLLLRRRASGAQDS